MSKLYGGPNVKLPFGSPSETALSRLIHLHPGRDRQIFGWFADIRLAGIRRGALTWVRRGALISQAPIPSWRSR
jgi:hypothetical protein